MFFWCIVYRDNFNFNYVLNNLCNRFETTASYSFVYALPLTSMTQICSVGSPLSDHGSQKLLQVLPDSLIIKKVIYKYIKNNIFYL